MLEQTDIIPVSTHDIEGKLPKKVGDIVNLSKSLKDPKYKGKFIAVSKGGNLWHGNTLYAKKVKSLLGPEGDIHKNASAEQSDREYIKQMQFKSDWKTKNPGKKWPGYDKAGFK